MLWRPSIRQAGRTVMLLGSMVLMGCGGSDHLAPVTGIVTLNQTPLAGALVRFQPVHKGSPSSAVTDASGRYELTYTRSARGAEVGVHRVSISTHAAGDPDAESPRPSIPELVPVRYNSATELTAEVKPGSNQLDFSLDGSGPVVQPGVIWDE